MTLHSQPLELSSGFTITVRSKSSFGHSLSQKFFKCESFLLFQRSTIICLLNNETLLILIDYKKLGTNTSNFPLWTSLVKNLPYSYSFLFNMFLSSVLQFDPFKRSRNLLHPKISMHTRNTVPHTFPKC